jgi:hypothetical protein
MRTSKIGEQEMIAFEFRELLDQIVKDLDHIEKLIPAESSRTICDLKGEPLYIVEGRKKKLLSYIQVVLRDHIYWGKRLLDKGWLASQRKAKGRKK